MPERPRRFRPGTVDSTTAGFRPGTIDSTTAWAKHALRALGRRWLDVASEIASHDRVLEQLSRSTAEPVRGLRDRR